MPAGTRYFSDPGADLVLRRAANDNLSLLPMNGAAFPHQKTVYLDGQYGVFMKPCIKFAFLIIFSICLIQVCLAQDLASSNKPKNKTERLVIAKIHALPEVRDFFKYVKKDKADFIINPPDSNNNYRYAMQVGVDYGDVFRTFFWLLVDPKTFQVYYEDFDDSGMEAITLKEWRYWRNRAEFNKPHKWVKGKLVVVTTIKKSFK